MRVELEGSKASEPCVELLYPWEGSRVFYSPPPYEWQKQGGLRAMARRLSVFLNFPRSMAFALAPEGMIEAFGGLPAPIRQGGFSERRSLEAMIIRKQARIHNSSWLGFTGEKGWQANSRDPFLTHPVEHGFPPRLVVYETESSPKCKLICSFQPVFADRRRMGRLGVYLEKGEQMLFIGQWGQEGLEVVFPTRERGEKVVKSRGIFKQREEFLRFKSEEYIKTAAAFLKKERFGLDIWIPYELGQEQRKTLMNVKLFGAHFSGISLLEIMAS